VRGKRRSAALLMRGMWDGLLDREQRIDKQRMEETADDYRVEVVDSFPADVVFDKQTNPTAADALRAFGTSGRRVLHKRYSLFSLIVSYYLCSSMAMTDGETVWRVKDRPREGWAARLLFWLVAPLALLAAPFVMLFGLALRRGPAIEPPRPSTLTAVEFPAQIG